jgi:hypothetical protein
MQGLEVNIHSFLTIGVGSAGCSPVEMGVGLYSKRISQKMHLQIYLEAFY